MKFTVKEIAGVRLPAGSKDFVWWDDEIAGFGPGFIVIVAGPNNAA
jgi:hypothetical protein